jgi:hypothetical protein
MEVGVDASKERKAVEARPRTWQGGQKTTGAKEMALVTRLVDQNIRDTYMRAREGSQIPTQERNDFARIISQAWKPTTMATYRQALERAQRWLAAKGLNQFPIADTDMARYLSHLCIYCEHNNLTSANIAMACAAVNWAHVTQGRESPTSSPLVIALRKGASKGLTAQSKQKTALQDSDIQRMFEQTNGADSTPDLVMLMQIAVMTEGLMRFDDAAQVGFSDIS